MKKDYLIFLCLVSLTRLPVFGQFYLRVENGPNIALSHNLFYNSAGNYINPSQVYYRNGQFLRLKVGPYFHVGIGLQEEWLNACASCLRYKRPDFLEVTEISYDYYLVKDSCTARLQARTMLLSIPAELGFTLRRKKSPWALTGNVRLHTYTFGYRSVQLLGDTVNIQRNDHFKDKASPNFFNWQASLGASYRINKRTFLSADLSWSNYQGFQSLKSIGLNIGLDYVLIKP
ncbi:MAG: hypothetical protein SFV55_10675 [Haliscomenobacter sp.]|uniref:hypothetical protein n=1 Tax=Haliscomenobacter sp. TaxID=2717303 RepID=UPI0029B34E01|nr:hypothetical protein [Haliscomenobacter sp.]MDX2068881.1 hypothetical protein [Haliscomenobacter sp.]